MRPIDCEALESDGLLLRLVAEDPGVVEVQACTRAFGFSGTGRAYFELEVLQRFADSLGQLPLGPEARAGIRGGYFSREGELRAVHLALKVFEVDAQGHLACAVTLGNPYVRPFRLEVAPRLELAFATSYGPAAGFAARLAAAAAAGEGEAILLADAPGA